MDGDSSSESDVSDSWILLDRPSSCPQLDDLPDEPSAEDAADYLHVMELSSMSKHLDKMHRSCELLSSSLNSYGRPVIADSVLEKAQSIYDIVMLDSEIKGDLLGNHDTKLSDTDSVDILYVESKLKDLGFETDEISVISEGELASSMVASTQTPKKQLSSLRRRRKKLNSVESFDSLSSCSEETNSSQLYCSIHEHQAEQTLCSSQRRVYRHYRNNMANTLLSLAVGVIFTGVACIALGHFLGVHDAEYTADEMTSALKRLQMENLMLQSKLSQLSRAFFTLETSSKNDVLSSLTVASNQVEKIQQGVEKNIELAHDKEIQATMDSNVEAKPNTAPTLPADKKNPVGTMEGETRSKMKPKPTKPIWPKSSGPLADLGQSLANHVYLKEDFRDATANVVQSLQKRMAAVKLMDSSKVNQFYELDSKISNVIGKLLKELSKTGGNVESFVKKLMKFSERLHVKICKHVKNLSVEHEYNCDRSEGKLNVVQWYPVPEEKFQLVSAEPDEGTNRQKEILVADMAQDRTEQRGQDSGTSAIEKNKRTWKAGNLKQENDYDSNKAQDKNEQGGQDADSFANEANKRTWKADNLKKKDDYDSKQSEREVKSYKHDLEIQEKKVSKASEREVNAGSAATQKRKNFVNSKVPQKEPIHWTRREETNKPNVKWPRQNINSKRRKVEMNESKKTDRIEKKVKKEVQKDKSTLREEYDINKQLKDKLYKAHQTSFVRKMEEWKHRQRADKWKNEGRYKKFNADREIVVLNEDRWNWGGDKECLNVTGEWVYKWARGREQCRRYHRLSEWLFDRASGRKTWREEDAGAWQFERSAGREHSRNHANWFFRRHDARHHHRKGFSTDALSWI